MTSGRKAKQQRRELAATTPRDPALPNPVRRMREHPLGQEAGAYVAWQEHTKAGLLRIMEENRKALDQCTHETGCPSSVHYPDCWAAR